MTLDWLTPELDKDLREYCAYVSPDDGEDGYHNAIVSLLIHHQAFVPVKPKAFFRTAIRRNVQKIWRDEQVYQRQVTAYMNGEVSDYWANLQAGRKPHTHCRKGHAFTPDNIMYRGGNQARKLCKQCVADLRKRGKHP